MYHAEGSDACQTAPVIDGGVRAVQPREPVCLEFGRQIKQMIPPKTSVELVLNDPNRQLPSA